MTKKLISYILIFFVTSLAYSAELEYVTLKDIPYYPEKTQKENEYIAERCTLDLYYPKNKDGFATVVWFHGGGLTSGNKFIPNELKNKGIAVIAVNYRLSPKVKVRDCISDAAASVAWTFNNINKYGGNPNLIFISGHSAGGYLTNMIGMDKKWLAEWDLDANKIAGLIPFSGHTITHFTARKEIGIGATQPIIDELAPLFYVRADAPPLLMITGDRNLELFGRYEENAYMMRMMKVVGHKDTRLLEIQGYGHNMASPAYPILLEEIKRISDLNNSK